MLKGFCTGIFVALCLISSSLPATAQNVVSVAPDSGSGLGPQTFSFVYSDSSGYQNIYLVQTILNTTPNWPGSCGTMYIAASSSLYLMSDDGSSWMGPLTIGQPGTLQNSQCTLDAGASSASGSGTNLTVNLAFTFQPGFTGLKNNFMLANDVANNLTSGFQNRGSWTPAPITGPSAVSVTPNSGSGSGPRTFSYLYSDTSGYQNIYLVQTILNTTPNWPGSCGTMYIAASSSLYLMGDDGSSWMGPLTIGQPGTLQNSQCTLNVGASSVNGSGTNLTANLAFTFQPGFTSLKNNFMLADDVVNNLTSGFQNRGTWTPSSITAPSAVSVTPSSGSGSGPQIFSYLYSDSSGYQNIYLVQTILNTTLSWPGSCGTMYIAASGRLYLMSDDGSAWMGPLTIGQAGTLQNSQCTLDAGASSVNGSGTNLTVNLALTFQPGSTGLKNNFMLAYDVLNNVTSGLQNRGSWIPNPVAAPSAVSVIPSSGSGSGPQTFSYLYSDSSGYQNIYLVQTILNTTLSWPGSCGTMYIAPSGSLYLMSDDGSSWIGPVTIGQPGTLQNSQCTLNAGASSAAGSGTNLAVNLVLSFQPGFTGLKNNFMIADDVLNNVTSGLQNHGSWTPVSPAPPISVSVSPIAVITPMGNTQPFTATLQNDFQNRGVTWSLSGDGCSGTTCGTLSEVTTSSIIYTAPTNALNPTFVILTATSVQDSSKSAMALIAVTLGTPVSVSVNPKRSTVTLSQTQQFSASVENDPLDGGVTWSVDGIDGGTDISGTISSAGLFAPGTQPGPHTVTATSNSSPSVSTSATIAVTDLTGVFTYHNDTARTGQNLQEYALTPATVNSSTFGALFSCPVDGYVYGQPLYVANLNFAGQMRNVVLIVTEHDSVYAFDADSPSCLQLWRDNFLSSGVTTVPPEDTGETDDLVPEIGITSTPVIDPATNTIYVEAKTKEIVGSGCSTDNPCYVHRLHALDLVTGAEKLGSPVVLTAPDFVPLFHLQRPALLLNNGTVYVAFGSHGDHNLWQGWMMAYDAKTLTQDWAWHATDPANDNGEGAIWGSGNGPAADANGNIYVETGNGYFDGINNFSDSVLKLSPAGALLDYFTPFDQDVMQENDIDLGSSGPMILPDAVGSSAHPHLMIASGKVGVVYLLDTTALGQYDTATNHDVGEVSVGFNTTDAFSGFFGQPAYWNGNIFTLIIGDFLRQYSISNATLSTVSSSNSSNTFGNRVATPTISASGATNGIVWVADVAGYDSGNPVILDAYDATDVSNLLYSSPDSGPGAAAVSSKFTVPTIANGKVYVGGQYAFTVFGLLSN